MSGSAKGFASQGAPSPDAVINLKIGLAAKDWSGPETTLYQVSTPGSDTYGQHLSNDEVRIRLTSDIHYSSRLSLLRRRKPYP